MPASQSRSVTIVTPVTLAMAALARVYSGDARRKLHALAFWAALACGLLMGGVVAPLAAALTVIACQQRSAGGHGDRRPGFKRAGSRRPPFTPLGIQQAPADNPRRPRAAAAP